MKYHFAMMEKNRAVDFGQHQPASSYSGTQSVKSGGKKHRPGGSSLERRPRNQALEWLASGLLPLVYYVEQTALDSYATDTALATGHTRRSRWPDGGNYR